ncbi:hypothetical protein [Haloarchaeobius sp. TZWWS8]|uniref:hypothetical protein n=1 Tax=Haloarchaeobius sp. TZWWS8 TaxID=3446121 RepID=UPI003EBFF153
MPSLTDRFSTVPLPTFAQVETALALLFVVVFVGILATSGSIVGASFEGNQLLFWLFLPVFALPVVVVVHAAVDVVRAIGGDETPARTVLGHLARVVPAGVFFLGIWLVTQVDGDAEFDPLALLALLTVFVGTVSLVGMVLVQAGLRLVGSGQARTEQQ